MACKSVTSYSKQCGKGINGGVQKLWIIGYSDLGVISGSTENFALASGSTVVSNIALTSGSTKFVSVGLLKESVSFKGTAKRVHSRIKPKHLFQFQICQKQQNCLLITCLTNQ